MAKRGRPPKSPAGGPQDAPGAPLVDVPVSRPPKPLTIREDAVAAEEWDRVCDLLSATLTPADVGILTAYCSTFAIHVHARRQLHPSSQPALDEDGAPLPSTEPRPVDPDAGWDLLAETAAGGSKVHGLVGVVTSTARDLKAYSSELGMTPAARARAGQAQAQAEDEFDRWVKRNRGG